MEQLIGSRLRKVYERAVCCHPEHIIRNAGLDELQAGIKIARRNINNLRYANDNHFHGIKRRGTKEILDEGERGE